MKLIVGFTIFLIFSSLAFATPKNVFVQCSIEGPVYSGTLDFEQDISKWKPASACRDLGNGYFRQTLYIPPFTLTFNGVSYLSKSGDTYWNDLKGSCDWSTLDAHIGFSIFESRSKLPLTIWTLVTEPGKFPNQFRIEDPTSGGGSCQVKVL